MAVYAVAQLRFTDRAAYDRYQAQFIGVFERYRGTLLAADEAPRVIEGSTRGRGHGGAAGERPGVGCGP